MPNVWRPMSSALLLVAICLLTTFVVSIPLYWYLLRKYAPRRYTQLEQEGRFRNMPETWDELWSLWTEPQTEFVKQIQQLSSLEDPRVFYGRFVDLHLMPIPYMRAIGTAAFFAGGIFLIVWLIAWLI
jgi:hypothetical protein